MKRHLAVFDIDGVLYSGNIVFDVIKKQDEEEYIASGTWEKIVEILTSYKKGEIAYKDAANKMLDVYVMSLKGKTEKNLEQYLRDYLTNNENHFYPYVQKLVEHIKKTHDIYIITTNLEVTAKVVSEIIGAKGYLATKIEENNGTITGKVLDSLAGNKDRITNLIEKYSFEKSIAFGDSENDISMLEKVEFPIAVNPDERLEKLAKEKNWNVVTPSNIYETVIKIIK